MPRRAAKRRQPDEEEPKEDFVDDLAHAATFAVHVLPTPSSEQTLKAPSLIISNNNDQVEDDEIHVDDDDDDDDDNEENAEEDKQKADHEDHSNTEKEDDESDVDLAEAVSKMQETDDIDEDGTTGSTMKAPTTEHEVDAYQTPIQQLEQQLFFQLAVAPTDNNKNTNSTSSASRNLQRNNFSIAGTIKHYLALDRTVVVESLPPHNGQVTSSHLDEGSLLVIQEPAISTKLIPLGRIFEVFGPVSQPLYTIRLPEPQVTHQPAANENEPSQGTPGNDASTTESRQTHNDPEAVSLDRDPMDDSAIQASTAGDTGNDPKETLLPTTNGHQQSTAMDPWSSTGEYGQLLQTNPSLTVYVANDEARLIDTSAVLKSSGKGCDASNLYDEEVLNANEVYYSDDEAERHAKSKRRGTSRSHNREQATTSCGPADPPSSLPSGFHHAPATNQRPTTNRGGHQSIVLPTHHRQHPHRLATSHAPQHATGVLTPPPPPPGRSRNSQPPAPYPTSTRARGPPPPSSGASQNSSDVPYYQY